MWTQSLIFVWLATGLLAAPERPEAGLSCPRSQGLFSHPTDCHLFLHCDHGHPYVKECPADLYFNPTLMVCDWPENVGCTGGTPTAPPTPNVDPEPGMECDCECCLKPDGDDCTSYYICKDGKAYKAVCAPGLVFNPDIGNCDLASNYKCEEKTSTPKPTTTKAPTTTSPKSTTTTTQPPKPANFDCPSSNGLFPNPKDCHSFYHCSNGHAYLKDCPADLEFNPVLLVCDWPQNAGCSIKPTTSKPAPTQPSPEFVCPNDGLFPNPKDCHTFYHCSNGYAYLKDCPADLEFNPVLLVCDWPQNAGCSIQPTTPKPSPKPKPTEPSPEFNCPSDGLFPNPNDCHTFYHCSNGHAYLKDCPANLEFNPVLLVCDWPENAGCSTKPSSPKTTSPRPTTRPTPTKPSPAFECPSDGLFPNPVDCHSFYHCSNGHAYLKDCPADLEFNPVLLVCDWPQNAGCSIKPTTTKPAPTQPSPGFECPSDGLFPNPKDCHTFYHCSNGHAYLKDCPADLEFNPVLLVCDWPENAGCSGKPTPSPKPTSSPTPKPKPNPDIICPNDTCACRVPDPTDCNKFYQCKDGQAFPDSCPAGLVFNPATEVCDYAENVPGCKPTTPRPTTRPTTPSTTTKPTTRPTPKPTTTTAPTTAKPTTKPTPKPTTTTTTTTPRPTTKPTTKPTKKPAPKPDSESSEESGSGSDSSESGSKSKHSGSKSKHSGSKSKHSGSKSKHSGSKSKHSGSKSKHPGSKSKHSGSKSKHDKRSAELMEASAPAKNSLLYRNPDHGMVEDDDGFLESQFCPSPNGKFPSSQCRVYYHCVDGVPTRKRCLHGTRFYAPDQRCILGSC